MRFVAAGTLFYFIVGVQGAIQAQLTVNQAVHFTDWVIGHSHMAMIGFASFAAAGSRPRYGGILTVVPGGGRWP